MKIKLGIRLNEDLLMKIEELVERENRSRSNLIETLLYEAVKQRFPKWVPKGYNPT